MPTAVSSSSEGGCVMLRSLSQGSWRPALRNQARGTGRKGESEKVGFENWFGQIPRGLHGAKSSALQNQASVGAQEHDGSQRGAHFETRSGQGTGRHGQSRRRLEQVTAPEREHKQ